MSDSATYETRDFAVRHAAATKADAHGFKGVILERDGSTTATDGALLLNLRRLDAEPRESVSFASPDQVKDAMLRSKANNASVLVGESKPVEFDWSLLVPRGEAQYSIPIRAELLGRLAKAAVEALGKDAVLQLEFRDAQGAVVIQASDGERVLLGLFTPMWNGRQR